MTGSYYERNKEKVKARTLAYYRQNVEKRKRDFKVRELQLKRDTTAHYGGGVSVCVLCGDDRLGALHIDHIVGSGSIHRAAIKKKGGGAFYNWLKQQDFPAGYRTLCANCNWSEHLRLNDGRLSQEPAAIKARQRANAHKQPLIQALGGCCRTCPISDPRLLTIHHINRDGAEHRRSISNGKSGGPFYRALLTSGDFTGLELRCFSCNDAEEYERTVI